MSGITAAIAKAEVMRKKKIANLQKKIDDITEFADNCKEKAFKNIEAKLVQKMETHMRKTLSLLDKE